MDEKRPAQQQQLIELEQDNGDQVRHQLIRVVRLSWLAPEITAAILSGHQPEGLGARRLLRIGALPLCRAEQRRLLGFS